MKNRKSIRLKGYDYSSEGAYFVTICVKNRECLFGEIINGEMVLSEFGKIAIRNLLEISKYYENVEIDEFIIMPNHVHVIIVINDNPVHVGVIHELPLHELPPNQKQKIKSEQLNDPKIRRKMLLPKIIGRYKMNTSKEINNIRNTSGISFWQKNYYEHIIRNEESINSIRNYIIENPLKWHEDKENPINNKNEKIINVGEIDEFPLR